MSVSDSKEIYQTEAFRYFHPEVEIHVTTNNIVKNILFLIMNVLGN